MNKKIIKMNKVVFQNYCKKINFKFYLIPLVKKTIKENLNLFSSYETKPPYISIFSERENSSKKEDNQIYTDSIHLGFGQVPIPSQLNKVKNLITEKQVSVILSQSFTGDVNK